VLTTPRARLAALLVAWLLLGGGNALAHGLLTRNLPRLQQPPWYVALGVITAAGLLGGWWLTRRVPEAAWRGLLLPLLAVIAVPTLLNIWVQTTWISPKGGLVFGDTLDADVSLYFCYGRQFAGWPPTAGPPCDNPALGDGRYPVMEYPQGALGLFAGSVLLSGDSAATFRWVFPLVLLAFTLGSVALLHALGRAHVASRAAVFLAATVTLSPYLFRLAPVRYDIVPAFFLLLAVWLFTRAPIPNQSAIRNPQSAIATGLAIAAGALLKWLPGILLPFVAGYYLRRRDGRGAVATVGAAGLALLVVLVPFYVWDAARFWHPYAFQASRALIGESAWFVLQYLALDPAHALPPRPWGEPPAVLVGNGLITTVQIVLTALPLGLAAWRARTAAQWAALGLGSVAIFTLANRIFSPQFVLALGFTWAAALVILRPGPRLLLSSLLALLAAGLGNFLVFPLFPDGWVWASAAMFVVAGALTAAILGAGGWGLGTRNEE
jgi:hypothetical protein